MHVLGIVGVIDLLRLDTATSDDHLDGVAMPIEEPSQATVRSSVHDIAR